MTSTDPSTSGRSGGWHLPGTVSGFPAIRLGLTKQALRNKLGPWLDFRRCMDGLTNLVAPVVIEKEKE